MRNSLVSVVLPTYNHAELLEKALTSVLVQEYPSLEVVTVDDHSTDHTPDLLKEFVRRDDRIRVVTNTENKGFVKSLNIGIRSAQGKYIARIDDDDEWCDKEKTKKQAAFLETHPEYVVVGGGIIRTNDSGTEISRELFPETDKEIRDIMLLTDPIVHVGSMFRKDAWGEVGGYDERFDYSQDWELWAKLGKRGKYYNFQEYFVRSLFSSRGRSSKNMRHHLWLSLVVRKRYRNEFPHFWKGYMLGRISYLFSFVPVRCRVHPIVLSLKRFIAR